VTHRVLGFCIRALLRAFPRSFRERHGAEYLATVSALGAETRHRGLLGSLRLTRFVVPDLITAWFAAWGHSGSPDALKSRPNGGLMESLWQDLRYAARTLTRSKVFAATVIASLGLGIGANTLVYSLLDGVVRNPFPYPDADRLMAVGVTYPKVSSDRGFIEALSPYEYLDVRDSVASLERVAAFDLGNRTISGGDRPERVFTALVWGDPLATLGFTPLLGRSFRLEETVNDGFPVAMISHRVWQARFGSDSSLVGRTIHVNGQPRTIIGILPPGALLVGTDLWIPMGVDPRRLPRRARQFAIMGRLAPNASLAALNGELARIATRTEREQIAEFNEYEGWRLEATTFAEATSQRQMRLAGTILQAAVALLLLIACSNVASLLLSRAAARAPEISVRQALGARTRRLMRQLLSESLLLSLGGGVVGLALAALAIGPVRAALPQNLTALGVSVGLNSRVLVFTLLVSIGVGLLFGAAPLLQVLRTRGTAALGLGSALRTTLVRGGRRWRAGFLMLQVALSVILLVGAGVLTRSLQELQRIDLGFDARNVLTARISVARETYSWEQIGVFFEQLTERLRGLPGVVSASASTQYPPTNFFRTSMRLPGESGDVSDTRVVDITNATPEFFPTIGYRLQTGRLFGVGDTENAPPVAVLNETAARRFFPGRSPIGERVMLGRGEEPAEVEIVGVVADVRNRGMEVDPVPEVFMPVRQQRVAMNNQLFVQVRAAGQPLALAGALRDVAREMDPEQPVYRVTTIEQEQGDAMLQRRVAMWLLAIFAAVALLLASVGMYGLVSHTVHERVREIGIRMALGADGHRIVRLVVRQILLVVGLGTMVGVAGSLALAGYVRALVYGVSPSDPTTLAAVIVLLAGVAILAAARPALRAARVSPVTAVRAE
jgi:putative ABC transport system permease protein